MEIEKKKNLSEYAAEEIPSGKGYRIGIVTAEWNRPITQALQKGAEETLREHGVAEEDIVCIEVPGSFELTTGADMLLRSDSTIDAAICIGCVIQGETRHFDFICQSVSQGITQVALKHQKPVIFSVLTTNNMEQALSRSGGEHGNKGVEGAVSALKMIALEKRLIK